VLLQRHVVATIVPFSKMTMIGTSTVTPIITFITDVRHVVFKALDTQSLVALQLTSTVSSDAIQQRHLAPGLILDFTAYYFALVCFKNGFGG